MKQPSCYPLRICIINQWVTLVCNILIGFRTNWSRVFSLLKNYSSGVECAA